MSSETKTLLPENFLSVFAETVKKHRALCVLTGAVVMYMTCCREVLEVESQSHHNLIGLLN